MMILFGHTREDVKIQIKEIQKKKEYAVKMLDVEMKLREILLHQNHFKLLLLLRCES